MMVHNVHLHVTVNGLCCISLNFPYGVADLKGCICMLTESSLVQHKQRHLDLPVQFSAAKSARQITVRTSSHEYSQREEMWGKTSADSS